MMIIPQRALNAQKQAAHPETSVWVSANAGSGKTHVLTERVIRLMLNGTEPSRILCLTYTKAAAAVMKSRIFDRLSQWTALDDAALKAEIEKLEGTRPNATRLATARRLFAHALETPGGLKIQTIHAFCEALLHQFPLEANIAGHFEMLDDMAASTLMGEARRKLIETAYQKHDATLADAFMLVLESVGESGLETLLNEAVAKREALLAFLPKLHEQGQEHYLRKLLGLHDNDTAQNIASRLKEAASFAPERLGLFARLGSNTTKEFVDKVSALKALTTLDDIENCIKNAYFTATGAPRSAERLISKDVHLQASTARDEVIERQTALTTLFDRLTAIRLLPLNLAAFSLIEGLLSHYEAMKRARGLLDFDDLIHRSLALLKRKGAGQWVQYKLDQGIDHILVDEAQDTSPAQWEIVLLLTQEFFVGAGQRDVVRSIFAVGDEKQSIYSFQGAVPEDFAKNGQLIQKRAFDARRDFDRVRLDFSFRSTREVLSAVDIVFSTPENFKGLSAANEKTVHDAIRNDPGEVDIWDMISPEDAQEPDDWRVPVDQLRAPAVRLAELIADTIARWLKNNEALPGKNRPMKPSDIMVLVRKRDQFVPALARALKNRGVAVAGADRLQLTEHIAIRDLMALGRFVLQPHDDLALASLFKTPLFALSEDDLYAVAEGRDKSLWQSLIDAAEQQPEIYQPICDALSRYRRMADTVPVYEFYSTILSEDGGRRKILARLGSEASDVLDAFLDYTLSVQKTGLPGLQAFLETLAASQPEIKRELDQGREEVRIMTVHAAKGLEGAVVFLVDSGSRIWNSQHQPKLLSLPFGDDEAFVWLPTADLKTLQTTTQIEALKERAAEEYRRLLYVGMTRAEDRLIMCGYRGKMSTEGTWNSLVKNALAPHCQEIDAPQEGVQAWRYVITAHDGVVDALQAQKPRSFAPLPAFFKQKMSPESLPPRPLTPSSAVLEIDNDHGTDDADVALKKKTPSPILGDFTEKPKFSAERGTILHRLLQYLPDIAEENRETVSKNYLQKYAPHWTQDQRQKAQASILAILQHQDLAMLFSVHSRAEVSVMGKIMYHGEERMVSGQIDRLSIDDERVVIADYKTGYVPAKDDIPDIYIMQMALYRALLASLYKSKRIETVLIYTEAPTIYMLEPSQLDQAMQKLGGKNEKALSLEQICRFGGRAS